MTTHTTQSIIAAPNLVLASLENYAVTPAKYNVVGTICGVRVDFKAGTTHGMPPASKRVEAFAKEFVNSMEVSIVREAVEEVLANPSRAACEWLPKALVQMLCFLADLQDKHDVRGESLSLMRDLMNWQKAMCAAKAA